MHQHVIQNQISIKYKIYKLKSYFINFNNIKLKNSKLDLKFHNIGKHN